MTLYADDRRVRLIKLVHTLVWAGFGARTNCTRAQLRLDRILLGISPEADKPVLIVTARALPPRQLLLNGVRDLSEPQLRLGLEVHFLSARQSGKELLRRLARCGTEFVQ